MALTSKLYLWSLFWILRSDAWNKHMGDTELKWKLSISAKGNQ